MLKAEPLTPEQQRKQAQARWSAFWRLTPKPELATAQMMRDLPLFYATVTGYSIFGGPDQYARVEVKDVEQ